MAMAMAMAMCVSMCCVLLVELLSFIPSILQEFKTQKAHLTFTCDANTFAFFFYMCGMCLYVHRNRASVRAICFRYRSFFKVVRGFKSAVPHFHCDNLVVALYLVKRNTCAHSPKKTLSSSEMKEPNACTSTFA